MTKLIFAGEIFSIEAYCDESENCEVEDWLESLPVKDQVRFAALFERLGNHGKIFNEKKFKHSTETKQLFEFKVNDKRALSFFFSGKRVILTHGFTKKSQKTPKKEIEKAEKLKQIFEEKNK